MTTCSATDALLRVEYNITRDAWDSSRSFLSDRYQFMPFLQSTRYESFYELTDYETCVPRDECSQVVVGGLPTDGYKLSFDGEAVDIGYEFFFDGVNPVTSTEVGVCTVPPVCDDGEALLEIQYWKGSLSDDYEFRVEDKDSQVVLDGTSEHSWMTMTKTYACLPREDACYTFLIGGEYQQDTSSEPASSYSVIYDGIPVRSSDSWLFDSVRFGDNCELPCNPDNESQVEFFMYDQKYFWEVDYEYEWSLSSPSATVSGVVPQGPGISPFVYMSKCIPKDSCVSFNIVAPANVTKTYQDGSESTFNPKPVYTLIMDNVTYRKVQLDTPEMNETTNMGSCTVADLCDEETQDLFHLELHTQATNDYTVPPFPTVSLPMIDEYSLYWVFGEDDSWFAGGALFDASDYNDRAYDLDTDYGVIECVPKDGCDLNFYMTQSSPVESYTVKKNGIQLHDMSPTPAIYGPDELQMPFGQNCVPQPRNSLSGGAIGGIVIGCLVAVVAVVAGVGLYKKRQNQSAENGGEEALRESLL